MTTTSPTTSIPTSASHTSADGAPTGRRVLVATDLGPAAESTLRVAHARASGAGGALAVVHVVEGEIDGTEDALRALVREVVGSGADDVEVRVRRGDPATDIAEVAREWDATLLVIGRSEQPHGVVARMFAPGVVVKLVRNAPCDVLVSGRAPATGRIVVGTDLDDPSLPILRAAAAEQARRPVTVYAVHCVEDVSTTPAQAGAEAHEQLRAAAEAVGLAAVPQVISEGPSHGLLAAAKELAADLIVVGSHGEAGRARLLIGSVAQDVVEDAPCPVLVVRMPDQPH